jgi:hypothetical protein
MTEWMDLLMPRLRRRLWQSDLPDEQGNSLTTI